MSREDKLPHSHDPDSVQARVAAIIAEYASLREEIANRSRDQLVCVTASLVGVAALLGTVASNYVTFARLLFVVPWILGVFGILWCDHAHGIHLIATYIREEIECEKLPRLLDGADRHGRELSTMGWQTYLANRRVTTHFLDSIHIVLPFIYFLLPSLIAIVAYYVLGSRKAVRFPHALELIFLGLEAMVLVVMFFFWWRARRVAGP